MFLIATSMERGRLFVVVSYGLRALKKEKKEEKIGRREKNFLKRKEREERRGSRKRGCSDVNYICRVHLCCFRCPSSLVMG